MSRYIYQQPDWPRFHWNQEAISTPLTAVRHRQGRLIGRMEALGFPQRDEAVLETLTLDVLKSSEIEGQILNPEQVRSSVARRLGMDIAGLVPADRRVDGVVQMTLEATQNFAKPLTAERLFSWHAALFPTCGKGVTTLPPVPAHYSALGTGDEGTAKIRIGAWRDDAKGPMQVVSGAMGRERVHFEAPPAKRLDAEMASFLDWVNRTGDVDPVLRAAEAHLWFVTIHPFDDGNGRIARAIADWALARSENSSQRFYSMSAQIRRERKEYYDILERTQKGTLDVTDWMQWFLGCLDRAIAGTETSLGTVFHKDRFWKSHIQVALNERQRLILNKLLDGDFGGNLTSSKWAKLTKCSQDTAHRDILDLVEHGILVKDSAGGRSTSYSLKEPS
ncbi:MAG: Fic family protein [Elusimicrobia bacterium]|nr:Fic family protein [Elusimicrobiota bacterium]